MTDQLSGFALIRAAYDVPADEHERAVLVLLAVMANTDAQAWPSIAHIVERTGKGERTVQRAIQRLAAAGHVTRKQLRRGVVYTVHPKVEDESRPARQTPDTGTGDAGTGVPQTLRPVPQTPKLPRTTNTSQKATPSSRTRARRTSDVQMIAAPPDLPEWVPRESWAAYAEMRAGMAKDPKKPRPWTPSVASKAVEQLERLARDGHDPARVLDQSVLNGWQGLFGIKSDDPGRGGRTVRAMQRVNQMLSEYGQ